MEKRREINCLRCGTEMRFVGRDKLQLGQMSWVLGELPNLIAGAMPVDLYACPDCGKIELFRPGTLSEELPQKRCPHCGALIDFDYGCCPRCRYEF